MSSDSSSQSEVEQWDDIQAKMLDTLRESVRLGALTPDQYSQAMSDVVGRIREQREQAELRDLWRWADKLAASDSRYEGFATFVRQFIMEKQRDRGKLGPP